jgi:hypothetical protein
MTYKTKTKLYCILAVIVTLLSACEDSNDSPENFYNADFRIGVWTTADNLDTLDFQSDNQVIRKGAFYTYETYTYRITEDTLYFKSPDSSFETSHPVLEVSGSSAKIDNMYITGGFKSSFGVFYKDVKP